MRFALLLLHLLLVSASMARAAEPLRYALRLPAPHTHYVEVEATLPTGGAPRLELMMPVWTPGSYLVREFSRNVEGLRAEVTGGGPLRAEKTAKNRWVVETGGATRITVRYRVYGHEMSVRTNFVDADFALLNGAPTFLVPVTRASGQGPFDLQIDAPPGWGPPHTPLDPHPDGKPGHLRAPDFDALVDSPIVLGKADVRRFEVAGKKHEFVVVGDGGLWDLDAAARDVQRIVDAEIAFWGTPAGDARYVFLLLCTETGGGLEHRDASTLMTSRFAWRNPQDRRAWYALVAHEYFHAWNVKRLRPAELGPFDYEIENPTRSLWIAEGVTAYYDDLLVRRAGLTTDKQFLETLSKDIQSLQKTPGRAVQSLQQASQDAWIKLYRPDENTANSAVSYYVGGAVVAWLLDARVRRASGGKVTLDDLMRAAWQRFGDHGYTPEQFAALASTVAGVELGPWLRRHTAEPLADVDYAEALAQFGLRFAAPSAPKEGADPPKGWLGIDLDAHNRVKVVMRGTPAHDAGLSVGDELLAVDAHRVAPGTWEKRRGQYRPGDRAELLVARRERLRRVPVTFGAPLDEHFELEVDPTADAATAARRGAWLGGASRGDENAGEGAR